MILVRDKTPEGRDSHDIRFLQLADHGFNIVWRIHRVRIDADVIFAFSIVETATPCIAAALLFLEKGWNSGCFEDIPCLIH